MVTDYQMVMKYFRIILILTKLILMRMEYRMLMKIQIMMD